jgi:hypothetical protein
MWWQASVAVCQYEICITAWNITGQDPLVTHHRPDKAACLTTHYMFTHTGSCRWWVPFLLSIMTHNLVVNEIFTGHSPYGHFKHCSSEWLRSGICLSATTVWKLGSGSGLIEPTNIWVQQMDMEQVKCNADHNLQLMPMSRFWDVSQYMLWRLWSALSPLHTFLTGCLGTGAITTNISVSWDSSVSDMTG